MTDPRTLAEEAKSVLSIRDHDKTHYEDCWRIHFGCLASFLADALITALNAVDELSARPDWALQDERDHLREENERLREALEHFLERRSAAYMGPDEFYLAMMECAERAEAVLTETPERP